MFEVNIYREKHFLFRFVNSLASIKDAAVVKKSIEVIQWNQLALHFLNMQKYQSLLHGATLDILCFFSDDIVLLHLICVLIKWK